MWRLFKRFFTSTKKDTFETKEREHKPFNLDLESRSGFEAKQRLETDSKPERLKMYADAVRQLPMPSALWDEYQRLSRAGASNRKLSSVIKGDPVLSAQILKVVNAPAFGLRKPIVDLNRAISHLGNNLVRSIVAKHCFSQVIPQMRGAYNLTDLWKHGMAVSALAEVVSKHIPNCETETAVTIGLFHDIGRMGLNFVKTERKSIMFNHEKGSLVHESERFGCTHVEVGSIFAKHWNLPEKIQQGIHWHHHPGGADKQVVPESIRAEVFAVYVADLLAKHLEFSGGNASKTLPHESYTSLLPKTTLYDLMQDKTISKELWRINCIDF